MAIKEVNFYQDSKLQNLLLSGNFGVRPLAQTYICDCQKFKNRIKNFNQAFLDLNSLLENFVYNVKGSLIKNFSNEYGLIKAKIIYGIHG